MGVAATLPELNKWTLTILNENLERVHVRWTAKRGNEFDLIGQLNVA